MKQQLRSLKSALRNHSIFHPTSFLKASIWLVGLSLLVYRSASDFLDLVNEYMNRNVATEIVVLSSSSSTRPSSLTVCIPYYSNAIGKLDDQIVSIYLNESIIDTNHEFREWAALQNRSWDVWSHPDFDWSSPQLVNFFLERIVRESDFNVLELNRTNFNWNQPILDAVWKFLSCLHNRDVMNLRPSNPDILELFTSTCSNVNFTRIGPLTRRTIDRLLDSSIRAFDVYARVIVQFPPDLQQERFALADRRVLKVSDGNLCVPLLSNSTSEMFAYRPNFDDPEPPPWKRYTRTDPFQIWSDDSHIYGAESKSQSLYMTDFALMSNLSAEFAYYSYGIDWIVQETRPYVSCNEDFQSSYAYCLAVKQIDHAKKVCGCVPFAYRHLDSTADDGDTLLPYCDSNLYGNCSANLLSTFDRYSDECTNRCKYVFYKWRHHVDTSRECVTEDDDRWFAFQAWITPTNREPSIQFSLTTKSTWVQFISQIGGVVNFYLGFSGLSIFAFLIVCMDVIGACMRMRMGRRSGRGDRQEIPGEIGWAMQSVDVIERFGRMEKRMEAFDDKFAEMMKILGRLNK